jgi:ubiquinone/menaquinone biosynthesis C-methylase UbiE
MFRKMIGWYDDGVGEILDVGSGQLYPAFRKTYGERYVGLDLPSTPFPKTVEGDAHDLSRFADGNFHLVTMFSVIEHLKEPYRALGEAIRVARRAVILTTDLTQADKDRSNCHYYAWTPKTLNQLLSLFGKARVWTEMDVLCGVIEK